LKPADVRSTFSRGSRIGPARARLLIFVGRLVSGTLFILGILGMLRTGADEFGSDSAEQFVIFTVHPLTAVVWTVLGVVGIAMVTEPARARLYLAGAGLVLIVWGILGLALDGSPSQLFVRDTPLIVLHLVGGAISLAAVLVPLPERAERMAQG
jgi:hypothetical protein